MSLFTLCQKSIFCQKKKKKIQSKSEFLAWKTTENSLFRVTSFLKIRVGWILKLSKIQRMVCGKIGLLFEK